MVKVKKCYLCLTEVDEGAKICPRCKAKLGARKESGVAGKRGFPLFKILLAVVSLGVAAKISVRSHSAGSAAGPEGNGTAVVSVKDGAIRKIKEKGAGDLGAVGVADIGYKEDTLCVYVDQRFTRLSRPQQEQLLGIVAGEWVKALGKDSTEVKVLEYGTDKTLAELVV
ncbi:MAG TPA: hypothetical protein DCS63_01705 [Elusimicrobia bacterium]|nr:hypothetical protein [Elusimicrobiota bacterium]